jgi:hypothetical protein
MQPSQVGNPIQTRVVCASIRPSVTSDKVRVRTIRVNVLVTLDRVNLDLLCPRWLPHCYHVGWSGCCGRIRLAERRIRRWRGTYACVRGAYDRLWGAYACRRGAYAYRRGAYTCRKGTYACIKGTYGRLWGAYTYQRGAYTYWKGAASAVCAPTSAVCTLPSAMRAPYTC